MLLRGFQPEANCSYFEKSVFPGFFCSFAIRRFCARLAQRIARLSSRRCSVLKTSIEFSEAFSIAWWAGRAGVLEEFSPCAIGGTSTAEQEDTPGRNTSM